MSETGYLVSQASKLLEVQSHVLRYWEEELLLPIGRNELGHRYYTRYDIQVILCIKELKKKGFPLKEIKKVIPLFYEVVKQEEKQLERKNSERKDSAIKNSERNLEKNSEKEKTEKQPGTTVNSGNRSAYSGKRKKAQKAARAREQKKKKEQNRQNNRLEGQERGVPEEFMEILDRIVKERMKEQTYRNQEEEQKCRKLDEKIRTCQKARKEVAAAVEKEKQEKHRFFRKKKSDA